MIGELAKGDRLAQFVICGRLGAGGMGVVYRAEDTKLQREVALKVLPQAVVGDGERRQRFMREARAGAAIVHANVVTLFEIGEQDEQVFLAMELVEGQSLREHLSDGPLDEPRAIEVAVAVARALSAAHAKGIVHRDIKPDNVMITESGDVKVLDFGLAKVRHSLDAAPSASDEHDETATAATEAGRVLGTPGYMSPEQALGEPVDLRTDIFSAGVVLYEMVTGCAPFRRSSSQQALVAVARDAPPPMDAALGVSEHSQRIIARCLTKDPDRRYPSTEVLLGDLLREGEPGTAEAKVESSGVRRWLGWGAAAAMALAAVAIAVRWADEPTPANAPLASAPSSGPSPAGSFIRVVDQPLPASKHPKAIDAYRRAMQMLQDCDWVGSEEALQEAVSHDPSLTMAHLRIAVMKGVSDTEGARKHYRLAAQGRRSLRPRNRALIDTLEPLLLRDPPAARETVDRMVALSDDYPSDLELLDLGAGYALMLRVRLDRVHLQDYLARAERATSADPSRGDPVQLSGWLNLMLGNHRAGVGAIHRCVELSPLTNDCRWDAAMIAEASGDCEAMAKVAKQMVASNESDVRGILWVVSALAARGLPLDKAVDRALADRKGGALEAFLLGARAASEGRFADLDEHARVLSEAGTSSMIVSGVASRIRGWFWLGELARESDQPELARAAVERFFEDVDSATKSSNVLADARPYLWQQRVHAGLATQAELDTWRDGWLAAHRGKAPDSYTWFMAYASTAHTAEEARRALALKPEGFSLPLFYRMGHASSVVGLLEHRAGNDDAARPLLERAAKACHAFRFPFLHTRVLHALGTIFQADGAKPQACAAFGTVLDRWGKAQPKSVTAADARRRWRQLDCASKE